ncbi:MAG TPA: glycosyltransferase [Spirochaetales bacterium]|nr:glycosyltransferase [Spirochaetales bacterium]
MNIAIFTDTYIPQINGVTTSVLSFQRELEKAGHTVYIFCPSYGGREGLDPPRIFRFFSIPYRSEMMKEQRIALPLSRGLLQFSNLKIDIIHYQVTHYMGGYGLLLGKIFKKPTIHTYHTLFVKYTHYVKFNKETAVRFVKWISRTFCNLTDRVIAPSLEMKRELLTYGVTTPIEVLPTGIDIPEGYQPGDPSITRRLFQIPEGHRILIFVGRFAREKNIPLLLDVLIALENRGIPCHLILVGDGPDRKRLEREIQERNLTSRISITGYIPRTQVFQLLSTSDLFLFPSETETQGLVLLESMSIGLPAVGAAAMGAYEVLKDGRGGVTVPATVESFTDAAYSLLTDPLLYKEKQRTALEKAKEWSAQKMTKRLISIYQETIQEYRDRRKHLR